MSYVFTSETRMLLTTGWQGLSLGVNLSTLDSIFHSVGTLRWPQLRAVRQESSREGWLARMSPGPCLGHSVTLTLLGQEGPGFSNAYGTGDSAKLIHLGIHRCNT